MPYKDKETKKKHDRDYIQKKRGTTSEDDTSGTTVEMVTASYVQGLSGEFEALPERPRYLELSDGQVLDRANQPAGHTSGDRMLRMQACNESAYNFKPRKQRLEATR